MLGYIDGSDSDFFFIPNRSNSTCLGNPIPNFKPIELSIQSLSQLQKPKPLSYELTDKFEDFESGTIFIIQRPVIVDKKVMFQCVPQTPPESKKGISYRIPIEILKSVNINV